MHDYDRSSKWLIQHHGDSILRLGGLRNVRSWRPLQAEVVQPRQLPDGLLEVQLQDQAEPSLVVVEIATYPEPMLSEQVVRDVMLVYLDRRVLPDVLTLVLSPRRSIRVSGAQELASPLGWTRHHLEWRVVELWTLAADALLEGKDPGLLPWVPLAHFDGPPEPVFRKCRQQIDREATAPERANLLAVTQVLTRLRYNDPQLLTIFGGSQAMIESPLIQEMMAQRSHKAILAFLEVRFKTVPTEIARKLESIVDEQKLDDLARFAAECPDLEAFRLRLQS
jgi:hypothetical protein